MTTLKQALTDLVRAVAEFEARGDLDIAPSISIDTALDNARMVLDDNANTVEMKMPVFKPLDWDKLLKDYGTVNSIKAREMIAAMTPTGHAGEDDRLKPYEHGHYMMMLRDWVDDNREGLVLRSSVGGQRDTENLVTIIRPAEPFPETILQGSSRDSVETAALYLIEKLRALGAWDEQ